jgi:ATP-dependent DNA helicase PIF1
MRTIESEKEFSNWLLEVCDGRSGATISLSPSCFSNTQDPVQQLYGDINFNTVTAEQLKDRAVLNVTNEDYLELNNKVLDRMPREETVYKSVDNVANQEPSDHVAYPEEFLNSLIPTGMPPHELKLKVDAVIMLLWNLMPSQGLCNGMRLTITRLQRHIIEARVTDGLNLDTVLIPLIPSDTNMLFKFKRRQFPIRLAFSMTINKLQGQTFDNICLSFRNLYSVMGSYMLLSQEFDHWAH